MSSYGEGRKTMNKREEPLEEPLVSISCITFNHAHYIRKCLDSFLEQETGFKFEILIHDDASTDGTEEIIREYEARYPSIIKGLYEVENQWIKGRRGSAVFNFPRAKGKYIAMCEGDDYWTDNLKLQRQVDFLETHPDYIMVAENGLVKDLVKNKEYLFNKENVSHDVSMLELIEKRRFPTASVLFHKSGLEGSHSLKVTGDTILWVFLSKKGKIKFLPYSSSVYNRGEHGLVLGTHKYKWAELMEEWNNEIKGLMPANFDNEIFKQRNFNEYKSAFKATLKDKEYKYTFLSLFKMLREKPFFFLSYLYRKH